MLALRYSDEIFECLLDSGADVNVVDGRGRNILFYAPVIDTNTGKVSSTFETLLARGADIHHIDNEGDSVLSFKVRSPQDVRVVEELIRRGVRFDAASGDGESPLEIAENAGFVAAANFIRSHLGMEAREVGGAEKENYYDSTSRLDENR